jgi:hypothetical protein
MKQLNLSLSKVVAQQLANCAEQHSGLICKKQRQPEIRTPSGQVERNMLLSTGQSVLNLRQRAISQYNLIELQKAIDLAG